jgi:hypothetical protein
VTRRAKNRHVDLKLIEVPEKTARLQDALLHLLPGQRNQSRGAHSAATNHRRDGCRAKEDFG